VAARHSRVPMIPLSGATPLHEFSEQALEEVFEHATPI
jgi:hypothetical protein